MIKIPSNTNKYAVSNTSDLSGNISYGRNINLDEEGYVKLSSRSISVLSEKDDNADVGLPVALGRYGSIDGTLSFNVVTSDKEFTLNIGETALSGTEDGSSPQFLLGSHARWYRNLWTVSEINDFFTLSGGTYTDRGNLTTGVPHPVEVFRNRDTICIGDGNTVLQFDNTYSSSTTLTLSTDYEVTKLAYSNNRMGIITSLSDVTSGQNQEAYFFIWDGASTSAEGGFPIGSDKGIDVVAYKGSYAVLSRSGQLLFFTGGGFQELASLPFYFQDLIWGTSYGRDSYGDVMSVEGDVIYINFNALLNSSGLRYEKYSQNNPGGIWCYDPKVGLYPRYSPSISRASMITVTSANINTSTDVFTKTAGTIPATGNPIKYVSDKTTLIGGLETPKVYYVIRHNSTTFSLATTKENAINSVKIDITSTGASNNYFLALDVLDFGQSYYDNAGCIAQTGGRKQMFDHLIYGARLADNSSVSLYNHLCITIPGFENRGYFVLPKIVSQNVKDTIKKVFSSYRPLKEGDSIIYKIKTKEIVGLPVSTAQAISLNVNRCVWTSSSSFTTTADISSAKIAFDDGNELECELIAGAGSGTLTKITGITYSAGTYTVTLDEEVPGCSSGSYSDALIDNWAIVGTITSSHYENIKDVKIGEISNWFKMKIELRGTDVAIFDQKFINGTYQEAV